MVIMLIGNKCDLDRREVSFEEGAWFARQPLGGMCRQEWRLVSGVGWKGEKIPCSLRQVFIFSRDWSW